MVDKYDVSADKLTWTFTLRDGLEWHDGQPVTPRTASPRSSAGGPRFAGTADDGLRRHVEGHRCQDLRDRLQGAVRPRPRRAGQAVLHRALHDAQEGRRDRPFKQIDDYTGSGPFIFKKDEWKPGEKVVYVKNTKYKPRAEPPSMLAGGKVVKIDRLEWLAISDPSTAVNAWSRVKST